MTAYMDTKWDNFYNWCGCNFLTVIRNFTENNGYYASRKTNILDPAEHLPNVIHSPNNLQPQPRLNKYTNVLKSLFYTTAS